MKTPDSRISAPIADDHNAPAIRSGSTSHLCFYTRRSAHRVMVCVLRLLTIVALLILATATNGLCAKTIYVAKTGDDGSPGTSWALAKQSISAALDVADSGDQIWVASGRYEGQIVLNRALELYGGFAGTEASLNDRMKFSPGAMPEIKSVLVTPVTVENAASSPVVIDGFVVQDCTIDCVRGFVTVSNNWVSNRQGTGIGCGRESSATICSNTVSGYPGIYASGCSPDVYGNYVGGNSRPDPRLNNPSTSGIVTEDGKPRITNNRFVKNWGSGIECSFGAPIISKNTFEDNGYHYDKLEFNTTSTLVCIGCGIKCTGSLNHPCKPIITDNTVNGAGLSGILVASCESATVSGNVVSGGKTCGIELSGMSAAISGNTIRGNANHGIYCHDYASATIEGNVVYKNVTRQLDSEKDDVSAERLNWHDGLGGGIYCSNGSGFDTASVSISVNRITDNSAEDGGGLYVQGGKPAIIARNIIQGNVANRGGGVYFQVGDGGSICGNVIVRNSALKTGGGIHVSPVFGPESLGTDAGRAAIVSNTIAENKATQDGGGVALQGVSAIISNNIVAFNSSALFRSEGRSELSNNCVFNPDGYAFKGLSPGASDLQVDPKFVDWQKQDYRLAVASPCIDTGGKSVSSEYPYDIDGHDRVAGKAIDIGAKEGGFTAAQPDVAGGSAPKTTAVTAASQPAAASESGAMLKGSFVRYNRSQGSETGRLAAWQAVTLNEPGALDWIQWGGTSTAKAYQEYRTDMTERKHNGGSRISPLSSLSAASTNSTARSAFDSYFMVSWRDADGQGLPSATNNRRFVYSSALQFSAQADETPKTLRVWAMGYGADGQMTADLLSADGRRLSSYTGTIQRPGPDVDPAYPDHFYGLWTFHYKGTAPGQSLKLSWLRVGAGAQTGNVGLQAAILTAGDSAK